MKKPKMIRKFLVPSVPWVDSYAKVSVDYAHRKDGMEWSWQDDISVVLADCDRKVNFDFSIQRGSKKDIAVMQKKLDRIYEVLDVVAKHLHEAALECAADAEAFKKAKAAYDADKKSQDYV